MAVAEEDEETAAEEEIAEEAIAEEPEPEAMDISMEDVEDVEESEDDEVVVNKTPTPAKIAQEIVVLEESDNDAANDQDEVADSEPLEEQAEAEVETAVVQSTPEIVEVVAEAEAEGEGEEETPCLVCGSCDDSEEIMLLCDGCDKACHLSCAGYKRAPKGDWFCIECKPTKRGLDAAAAWRKANGKENNAAEANAAPVARRSTRSRR